MEWILGIFFALMLGWLVYSIISTSADIRRKAQPGIDSFFDTLSIIAFWKRPARKPTPSEPRARAD